ncbi:hypothetical protein ACET3Z_009557 [Daucus carota]
MEVTEIDDLSSKATIIGLLEANQGDGWILTEKLGSRRKNQSGAPFFGSEVIQGGVNYGKYLCYTSRVQHV